MKLLSVLYHDLGDDYLSSYFKQIDSVTKEQIKEVANRYLDPEKFLLTIVGDESETAVKL